MSAPLTELVAGAISAGLLAYLVFALLSPERLS